MVTMFSTLDVLQMWWLRYGVTFDTVEADTTSMLRHSDLELRLWTCEVQLLRNMDKLLTSMKMSDLSHVVKLLHLVATIPL